MADEETGVPIYTIGYGQRTIDELAALLKEHGVECLVDVRTAPYSRFRPEFSRTALQAAIVEQGLRYIFQGASLGGRPDYPDCYVDGKVDYDRIREKEFYREGIERLRKAAAQGMRVALMCSEGRPEECHRSKLIGVSLAALGIPVLHLDEDGRPTSQEEVMRRLTGGQLGLFGDPSFTSRKRYGGEP